MALKVAQQCGLMLCFRFSKAFFFFFFYLIRPRKVLLTCWWETMEKRIYTLSMVQFLSQELCLVGVGIECFQCLLLQGDSIEKLGRKTVQIQSRD